MCDVIKIGGEVGNETPKKRWIQTFRLFFMTSNMTLSVYLKDDYVRGNKPFQTKE